MGKGMKFLFHEALCLKTGPVGACAQILSDFSLVQIHRERLAKHTIQVYNIVENF